nr:T-complex protein 1, zeta SU [Cryptomonas curvata]
MNIDTYHDLYDYGDVSYANALSLSVSINAAKGLQEIMKSNLGLHGTLKMLVSSSGELKITKDGFVLLREMQIQNPIASLIAKTVAAQNHKLGDGTTSIIVILGELFKQIEKYIEKGIHPQVIHQGIDLGRRELEKWLPSQIIKLKVEKSNLILLAKSVLSTKLKDKLAFKIAHIVTDAILTIYREGEEIDLDMIEIISMESQVEFESRFIKGIVLDHGSRHIGMPSILNDSFILLCNISLEYEKTELDSEFMFNSTDKQEKLSIKERECIDKKVKKIIQLKRSVCRDSKKGFLVINQKGIDVISLDLLSKEGILGIRRAKRRNMERISLMCNAVPINSVDNIKAEVLGYAGLVYEQIIGEEKYTFIENVSNPFSGTILIKGRNSFLKQQIKDVIQSSLTTLKLFIKDKCALMGGGRIELASYNHLISYSDLIKGRKKFGIIALAIGILNIPKILSENSGEDPYLYFNKIENTFLPNNDLILGSKWNQTDILDCFTIKKQIFNSVCLVANTILLIDEIILGKGLN